MQIINEPSSPLAPQTPPGRNRSLGQSDLLGTDLEESTPTSTRTRRSIVIDLALLSARAKRACAGNESDDDKSGTPSRKKHAALQLVQKASIEYNLSDTDIGKLREYSQLSAQGMLINLRASIYQMSRQLDEEAAHSFLQKTEFLESVRVRFLAALISPLPHVFGKELGDNFATLAEERPVIFDIPRDLLQSISFARALRSAILKQVRTVRSTVKTKIRDSFTRRQTISKLIDVVIKTHGCTDVKPDPAHWGVFAFMRSGYTNWERLYGVRKDDNIASVVSNDSADSPAVSESNEANPNQSSNPNNKDSIDYYQYLDLEMAKLAVKYKDLSATDRKDKLETFYTKCFDADARAYGGTCRAVINVPHEWQKSIQESLADNWGDATVMGRNGRK